ncbi:hypothetical protein EVAR_10534_1 [Eumeta japonica]|uniref:Uncharacterized protein n=1 Tax=Eumeta variegata TaxID=151549 RepID=A0A4C1TKS2_EUMVA|nr:hypothetical protein EVAR_10534_1 [Eumeta japonica]
MEQTKAKGAQRLGVLGRRRCCSTSSLRDLGLKPFVLVQSKLPSVNNRGHLFDDNVWGITPTSGAFQTKKGRYPRNHDLLMLQRNTAGIDSDALPAISGILLGLRSLMCQTLHNYEIHRNLHIMRNLLIDLPHKNDIITLRTPINAAACDKNQRDPANAAPFAFLRGRNKIHYSATASWIGAHPKFRLLPRRPVVKGDGRLQTPPARISYLLGRRRQRMSETVRFACACDPERVSSPADPPFCQLDIKTRDNLAAGAGPDAICHVAVFVDGTPINRYAVETYVSTIRSLSAFKYLHRSSGRTEMLQGSRAITIREFAPVCVSLRVLFVYASIVDYAKRNIIMIWSRSRAAGDHPGRSDLRGHVPQSSVIWGDNFESIIE